MIPASSPHTGALDVVRERGRLQEREGRGAEARALYEGALRDGTATTAREAGQLLRLVAGTWLHDPDHEAARDCAEAALVVARQAGDLVEQGYIVNILAVIEWQVGNLDEAARLYLSARGFALEAGDARLAAMIATNLGVIANVRGDVEEARDCYESALRDARGGGLVDRVIQALGNLGLLDLQTTRLASAERYLTEAHHLSTVIGDRSSLASIELLLIRLHLRQDDLGAATERCAQVRTLIAAMGEGHDAAEAEQVFGLVAIARGDLAAAEEHLLRAEAIAAGRRDLVVQGDVARELADLYRRQGRNRQALQRLNHAHRAFAKLRARRELADVDRRTATLENDFLEVVRRWGESIESKDVYTQGHCKRVADLACELWTRVAGDETSLFWFRIGALLHDVGKLMVPAEILNKPGRLTDEEWALVRGHPTAGVALLADVEFPWDVRPIVESHHERWDGGGYPHGLAGDAIPLTARVLCIADVYDALTSERSYKRAFSHDEAMRLMRQDAGAQFDPALFAEFEQLMRGRGAPQDSDARHLTLVR